MLTEQPVLSSLRVEQRFQTLKQSLRLLASPRARMLHILGFAEPLFDGRSASFLAGYAAEIAQTLCTLILQTEFVGTPLTLIDRTQRLVETLARIDPEVTHIDRWETALRRLAEQHALILAWMQDRGSDRQVAEVPEGKVGCVWVPMVEQEPLMNATQPQFASLGLLHVDLAVRGGRHTSDNVHLAGLSQHESHNETHARTGLQAARALAKNITRKSFPRKVSARCWFSSLYERSLVVGESFEAGFAAAVATEMLRLQQHREEFFLRGDVALTGIIDPDGRLQPIAESGLPLKVQACT